MQYVDVNQATPTKIVDCEVKEPLKLEGEEVVLVEQRRIHFSKQEFFKSMKAIDDKLGYLQYQISQDNISRIQQQIDDLRKKKGLFENFRSESLK